MQTPFLENAEAGSCSYRKSVRSSSARNVVFLQVSLTLAKNDFICLAQFRMRKGPRGICQAKIIQASVKEIKLRLSKPGHISRRNSELVRGRAVSRTRFQVERPKHVIRNLKLSQHPAGTLSCIKPEQGRS